MRLRSPKDNEKGYETTQHMVSRESDSRPRFGGELESVCALSTLFLKEEARCNGLRTKLP